MPRVNVIEAADTALAIFTEESNTVVATAGCLLTAFGVVGTGGALLLLLLMSSSLLTLMKMIHIKGLNSRKTAIQDTITKKMYTALRKKEAGTALALGSTTMGASIFMTHSIASAATAMGVLHPGLSLVALGFAINAVVEFYDNVDQWREKVNDKNYYTEEEQESGLKDKQIAAARNLALSSFVKLLGWSCIVTGGFALAAPFAPWLIPGGLALIAGSHLYNNLFATPRAQNTDGYNTDASGSRSCWHSFPDRVMKNSCRGKIIQNDNSNVGLQLW